VSKLTLPEGTFRRDRGPQRIKEALHLLKVPGTMDGDTSLLRRINALEELFAHAVALSNSAQVDVQGRMYEVPAESMICLRVAIKLVQAAKP
jgi:hypothetical protein